MKEYQSFVDRLQQHLASRTDMHSSLWESDSLRLLNGLAAEELRRLVDIDTRRTFGAFFTDSELALDVIREANLSFGENPIFYDPAVGAGNLLLAGWKVAAAAHRNITLMGTDLHDTFVEAGRLRISLQQDLLPQERQPQVLLRTGDGLVTNAFYEQATHILTNPPFNQIKADKSVSWCQGKVSAAAVFIDRIIEFVRPGVQIVAILPDVLRSGSRYAKWRRLVESRCRISHLKMLGQFDKFADVDVFALTMTKTETPVTDQYFAWSVGQHNDQTVGQHFDISVGPVVDNRDPHTGPERPFLVSRGLAGWQAVKEATRRRRFSGRSVTGPFVVIKRTSRMGDKHRAIATIVDIDEQVFVDNHLIVVKPKSGKMKDCRKLVASLATAATDNWIDAQIRCRHLTVGTIERIPYHA